MLRYTIIVDRKLEEKKEKKRLKNLTVNRTAPVRWVIVKSSGFTEKLIFAGTLTGGVL